MKRAIVLHTNFVLPREDIDNRLLHSNSFPQLSDSQSGYCRKGSLTGECAKQYDCFIVQEVIIVDVSALVSISDRCDVRSQYLLL